MADVDASRMPWLLEDPLGVAGTRLQCMYQVGGAGSVSIGEYRVTGNAPTEKWRSYVIDHRGHVNPGSPIPKGKRQVMVSSGASLNLSAEDLAVDASIYKLLAPESPQGGAPTILSEIRRLMDGIAPVVAVAGVVDRAVNKSLIFEGDRLNAVQDLCKRIGCNYRMNGDAQLEVYPLVKHGEVRVLRGGDDGMLVDVQRGQKLDGLYNMFIADGTATIGGQDVPIRGIATIDSGALKFGGAHGRYPKFYESTMLNTQQQCDEYAREMRDTQLAGLTQDLDIICLPDPSIQVGDWVQVATYLVGQQEMYLIGRVTKMDLKSSGSSVAAMTLTVTCSYTEAQRAFRGVVRG
ncbi:hypothetical protein [Arthrobacter sp. GMC3]|uniref:hypothetical protein n=1 Tax=Arthrobacter sp. GMC3 TaxID=2058894 RepID=UPI000CE310F3|nr:hypothetical protein [Arthrobacter sp. GMC3]